MDPFEQQNLGPRPRSSSTSSKRMSQQHQHYNQQQPLQQQLNQNKLPNNSKASKYELENSVAELFRLLNVNEAKNFNRETIAERLSENINRQSSKPFSLFYNRLVDCPNFLDKYQPLKCQNSQEVDPFCRFLVRVREDKNMSNFLNNYQDIVDNKVKFSYNPNLNKKKDRDNSRMSLHNQQQQPQQSNILNNNNNKNFEKHAAHYRSSSSLLNSVQQQQQPSSLTTNRQGNRPTSATSVLLNMVNQNGGGSCGGENNPRILSKSNTVGSMLMKSPGPTTTTPGTKISNLLNNNNSIRNTINNKRNTLNNQLMIDEIDNNNLNDSIQSSSNNRQSLNPTPGRSLVSSPRHHHHQHRYQTSSSGGSGGGGGGGGNRRIPPYMSRDFHPCDWPKENDCFNTLGNYPVQEQEQLLLRDLLFALIGIEGRYIRLNRPDESSHYKLILDPSADHFLSVTTNRILKLCYHYSTIISFIESRVHGLINQALVASIHQHFYDYNMTLCQMEESLIKNDLFLQKMFFILLPYFSTFSLLKEICVKLLKNKCFGGAVLTLLHEKTKSIQGMDNNALELCLTMTKSASKPYFDILKTWIYYGEIDDKRKEFFIEDTHQTTTSQNYHQQQQQQYNHSFGSVGGGGGGTNTPTTTTTTITPVTTQSNNHHHPHQQQGLQQDDLESDDEYDDDFGKFNDKYWDVRYRINSSKMPCFLKNHEQIIYKTGKYVSIINKVKQLYLKSSKHIPIPQMLAAGGGTAVASLQGPGSSTTTGFDTLRSIVGGPGSNAGGGSSLMFLNQIFPSQMNVASNNNNNANINPPLHHHPASTIVDNSFASMASSSSSNTSHSTNNGRGNTPAPAAILSATNFTPKPEEIYYSFDESTYLSPIISAYEEASSQLLHILIHESQLVETFNAVKHYMLLSMGDFIVHFMKFASKDLCKPTDLVVQHRFDSMMGMALGISVCHSDRQYLKDDPHVEFVGKSFLKQIYQIMKPFNDGAGFMNNNNNTSGNNNDDPSPSSSYLLRCDEDALDDDDDNEDGDEFSLNRSIIGSVIEAVGNQNDQNNSIQSNNSSLSSNHDQQFDLKIRQHKYLSDGVGGSGGGGGVGKKLNDPNNKINKLQTPQQQQQQQQKQNQQQQQQQQKTAGNRKLFCYESLTLKFDVPFPLSLIFTQKSIVCYELLFRYVFLCRYAEMELEETWKDNILNVQLKRFDTLSLLNQINNETKSSSTSSTTTTAEQSSSSSAETQARLLAKEFKNIHKKAFALRYKMIAFVRNFHYFYAFEVIDPFFAQFIAQITKRGSSLDSVIECHEKFLEHCFSSCFLTSIEITTIIIKIFTLCIELSNVLKDSIDVEDQSSMMENSCFFGSSSYGNFSEKPNPNQSAKQQPQTSSSSDHQDLEIHEKLNKIYFSDRINGGGCGIGGIFNNNQNNNQKSHNPTLKEIIDNANSKFDSLVSQLLRKIYSDNCEYHMMYPFVARLDYNDFYRTQMMMNET